MRGLAEAVPLYQDALQPAAKEIGTALQTVAKTIHIALAPISVLVWGYDQIKDFISKRVAEKLKDVPPENIVTPKANVAGPALESLRYTGHEETLREMYANLLAASMDKRTANGAHPAFVEIIRQLTPDEARILRLFAEKNRAFPLITVRKERKTEKGGIDVLTNFSLFGWEAGCDFPEQTQAYIDNLCRLGLIELSDNVYVEADIYEPLENHPLVKLAIEDIEISGDLKVRIKRRRLFITEMGKQFLKTCVISHDQKGLTK